MNQDQSGKMMTDPQLPVNLVRKLGGWGTRAQSYPMFSPTWFRYRMLSFTAPLGIFAFILFGIGFFASSIQKEVSPTLFNLGMAGTWVTYACLAVVGRWFATLVYRRHWSQRREGIGVVAAIVLGIALATALNEGGDAYMDHLKNNVSHDDSGLKVTFSASVDTNGADKGNDAKNKADMSAKKKIEREASLALGRIIWVVMAIWLGGVIDLVSYFRQRRAMREALVQQELDEAKVKRNEAEMRLSVLAAQIEPHFLFNTLAGVRSAIRSDPTRGIAIIDHLVEYLRATIPQMRSEANAATVLLESQLNAARAYLGVMSARLSRLSFSVDCAPELLGCPVPPLMLISLVENAVKHGIEPKPGATRIEVLARKLSDAEGEYIELSVSDDGVGFSGATSGSGIGLANIHERLAQLYGKKAQLSLKARPQGGVVASITLPIEPVSI